MAALAGAWQHEARYLPQDHKRGGKYHQHSKSPLPVFLPHPFKPFGTPSIHHPCMDERCLSTELFSLLFSHATSGKSPSPPLASLPVILILSLLLSHLHNASVALLPHLSIVTLRSSIGSQHQTPARVEFSPSPSAPPVPPKKKKKRKKKKRIGTRARRLAKQSKEKPSYLPRWTRKGLSVKRRIWPAYQQDLSFLAFGQDITHIHFATVPVTPSSVEQRQLQSPSNGTADTHSL